MSNTVRLSLAFALLALVSWVASSPAEAAAASASGAQRSCPLLPVSEAVEILGPEPELRVALEGGGCTYVKNGRTLTLAQPVSLDERATLLQVFESTERSQHGTPLADVGERACLVRRNSGWQIFFLVKKTFGSIETYGEGSEETATARRLEAIARAVARRLE